MNCKVCGTPTDYKDGFCCELCKDDFFIRGQVSKIKAKSKSKSELDLDMMIEAHWEYVKGLLTAHGYGTPAINVCEFHYKTAFKHGFRHALETMESK